MSNKEIAEDEIDLIALVKSLWISRKKILKITSLFLILGVIVALSSPVVYTASSTFIPQSNSSGGSSSLSGVASLVGIILFLGLFVIGLIFFSYLIVIGAVLGVVIFCVA